MLRRLMIVLLTLVLIVATSPLPPPRTALAQEGSPVPMNPVPTLPATEPVSPAEFEGNTPPGSYSPTPLFPLPRTDVYVYISNVTVGGQTDVIDGSAGNGPFVAAGYRSDNAKVITIETSAVYEGNLNVCVLFDGATFANPAEIDLFIFDGAGWTAITNYLDTNTVCGYSAVFGSFAVAEAGIAPSVTPTESPTSVPTSTNTATPPPTETPTSTSSATETHAPTETATHTASATSTSTSTATSSSSATSLPTETQTATITPTPTETFTPTPSETTTPSPTSTSAPSPIQFALPNVYVTYLQIPTAGQTEGAVLTGDGLPALSSAYRTENAWFFSVSSTVAQSGNKKLCVMFQSAIYSDPHRLVLLQSDGSVWSSLPGQVLESLSSDQGTLCGYVSSFGDFALVERAPATATVTLTPSRTPSFTPTATSTRTAIPSVTSTGTATPSPTDTPTLTATTTPSSTPTSSATSTSSATASPTASNSPTATLAPGSYHPGTALRVTTRVNLRSGAGTSFPSHGVLASGSMVTATGSSIAAGGYSWVPVSSAMGAGWIAGSYLVAVPTATPTRTPAPPTATRTPGSSTPTRTPSRTPTRPPGGFVAGDAVRTTASVNLRSAPNTSSTVLRVVPSNTSAAVTGPGVVSGGYTFYPVTISGYPAGYLAGAYLQRIGVTATPSRTRTPTATVVGSTVRFTTANVNLRTGPGTGYRIVTTIPEGTRVNITGAPRRVSGTDWYPIVINGVGSGWMSGDYLTPFQPI